MDAREHRLSPRRLVVTMLAASLFFLLLVLVLPAADAGAKAKPILRSVRATPASFYGGAGAVTSKRSTRFTYSTRVRAKVSVVVRNAAGKKVRTLRASRVQRAGKHALWWNGRSGSGSLVPVGKYSVQVTARAGSRRSKGRAVVRVAASPISGISAAPTAIVSGTGSSTLGYTLGTAATVSVVIQDASSKTTVRTLRPAGTQSAGTYSFVWDGKGTGDAQLPLGDYAFVIRATTPVGTVQHSATVQLVDTVVLGAASVSPASFYGGAGASGATTLSYTLNDSAQVSVIARDADGGKVATVQSATALASGAHSVVWSGVDDSGASLRAGAYTLVLEATSPAGKETASFSVHYAPTPVANEAFLSLNGSGGHVLHAVVESWDERLNGQATGDYYYDGKVQPWEYAATDGSTVTLYVGTNPVNPQDTTAGGTVTGTTDATGVTNLAFPPLSWSAPTYYSVKVSYGGSSRWYPAVGRYRMHPPTDADGHVQFAFMSDIQSAVEGAPVPDQQPQTMTGPYAAIPNLSLSLGWAKVLSGLKGETDTNLVVFGGDPVQRAGDTTAPDDGATQWRQLLDNEQTITGGDEWSLSSLGSSVPVQLAVGNHDDLGVGDAGTAAANRLLNNRWEYRPAQPDSDRGYYTFDQGDVHFVVMNPYLTTLDRQYSGWIGLQSLTVDGSRSGDFDPSATYSNSRQADWLLTALQTEKPWTVVLAHAPVFAAQNGAPWSQVNQTGAATVDNDVYYGERDRLLRLFAASGVDLVLQGHTHMFRHHVEKVQGESGPSAMTFITDGLAGAAPIGATESGYGAWLDWIDQLPYNGRYDDGEPLATPADPHYDASYFGTPDNTRTTASGYTGAPDMFHAPREYGNGVTFSYIVFQTGGDGAGAPTLTMEVKTVSWNTTTHQWDPWTVYESGDIPQVVPGMVAQRFTP